MKRYICLISLFLVVSVVSYAQTGTWSGKLEVSGMKLSIVFHLDDANPTVDSPDQGVKGIPAQIHRAGTGMITVRIPSLAASFEGQWLINKIVGNFTQMGSSLPLTLIPGEEKLNRPQTPVGPFPYETEEVSFTNGEVILNGTLVLPEGYNADTPVLLMVSGSGQQNRDEEIFEHKPFAVIADAFARAGIATLRYDDRGFSGYKGDINACTVDDFKNDASAGIMLLRERFDKVGVIGHSEGGTIALMLAAEGQADFIISLAGMAVSGAEALVWQNQVSLKEAGFSEEVVNTYCSLIGQAFDVKVNGGIMPQTGQLDLPDALKQNYLAVLTQIQTPYMSNFIALDIRSLLGDIDCPVFAINGTKDVQVDHVSNLGALRSGLNENPKNVIRNIEDVNHLFQHCATGSVAEYREIEETFSQDVLDELVIWMSDFK